MEKKYSIGVDIGGSHITSAAVDLTERRILRETVTERPVDNKGTAAAIIGSWTEALGFTISAAGRDSLKGIGFAMPGPFDYVNGICLIRGVPKYEHLYGTDIGKEISASLDLPRDIHVRFMNDASSFAVGEAWAGKAVGAKRSMAITLGTGLGSAFIEDNIPVVRGKTVPDLGCVYHIGYSDGIADDYFSTRWFTGKYHEITGREVSGVKEVSEAARQDEKLKDIFTEFGSSLAGFLSPYLLKFGAEVLVIGGNISRAWDLIAPSFEEGLKENNCDTVTRISELKEDAALFGSAYLMDDSFWNSVKGSLQYM